MRNERLKNASEEEIAELRSEISSLKSQLYQARKDVRDKGKYISSVNSADNTGGLPTGREVAIGYLRGCMSGRTLEWFDEKITIKINW
ncbi:9193_t:CDS:2, partial [Funneliformis geosporum]